MKRLAVLALAALLCTAGVTGLAGGRARAAAQTAAPTPAQTCVLIIFCTGSSASPSASPAPSPTDSTAAPAPSPSSGPTATATTGAPAPTADPGTTGGTTAPPSASASAPAGRPSATGRPSPPDSSSPSASSSPSGGSSPLASSSPSGSSSAADSAPATASATAHGKKKTTAVTPRDASAPAGLTVSDATWTMTVGLATMTGFTYQGNVDLPVAGGGTELVMEFTVRSMAMSDVTTVITESGQTGRENDASFTASGVTMYATKLSGSIFGVPVTFTPSTASAVLLSLANLVTALVPITMTGVTADQTVILAAQARKDAVGVAG